MIYDRGMVLVHEDGHLIRIGEVLTKSGSSWKVIGGAAPHGKAVTGRIYFDDGDGGHISSLSAAFDCDWRPATERELALASGIDAGEAHP